MCEKKKKPLISLIFYFIIICEKKGVMRAAVEINNPISLFFYL